MYKRFFYILLSQFSPSKSFVYVSITLQLLRSTYNPIFIKERFEAFVASLIVPLVKIKIGAFFNWSVKFFLLIGPSNASKLL